MQYVACIANAVLTEPHVHKELSDQMDSGNIITSVQFLMKLNCFSYVLTKTTKHINNMYVCVPV